MARQLHHTGCLKQLCFLYESMFKHSELEKVRLVQQYNDGTTKTKKCPMFGGKEGIKGLLYVKEQFCSVACQLDFTTDVELFNSFKEVLTDTAEEKWENLTSGIAGPDKTGPRFNQEIALFYQTYCDNEARDVMFDYLKTLKCLVKVTPRDHSDRVETMICYSNKLPGILPMMNNNQ
eukprot:8402454-Ditylum_brightwellii.AAC.1